MLPEDPLARMALLLSSTLAILGFAIAARMRHARVRRKSPSPAAGTAELPAPAEAPAAAEPLSCLDPAIEVMTLAVYRRAFGTPNFNYAILGEHQEVLERVRRSLPLAATRREYFPRKPLVVPRLLAAIKNSDSSLKELVDIIMQDPVLTGDVLRFANSPFYRVTKEPIDSIGRAVVLLGMDGLRSLIATSVMQPVFQVPKGYFEGFSETVWRQAQHSALAAQTWARLTQGCDSFVAHLLALLFHMSHIVLFRMTVASYVQAAGSLPRAEVFARLIDECAEDLAGRIASEWELAPAMIDALQEHADRQNLDCMSPLGRALYFGRICGSASIAVEDGTISEDELLALLQRKGLGEAQARALWRATAAREEPGA
jgi:HD-like signal output (HDOD) protein